MQTCLRAFLLEPLPLKGDVKQGCVLSLVIIINLAAATIIPWHKLEKNDRIPINYRLDAKRV